MWSEQSTHVLAHEEGKISMRASTSASVPHTSKTITFITFTTAPWDNLDQ
jgi:hypothetical protein